MVTVVTYATRRSCKLNLNLLTFSLFPVISPCSPTTDFFKSRKYPGARSLPAMDVSTMAKYLPPRLAPAAAEMISPVAKKKHLHYYLRLPIRWTKAFIFAISLAGILAGITSQACCSNYRNGHVSLHQHNQLHPRRLIPVIIPETYALRLVCLS